jgi:hypothetical protein
MLPHDGESNKEISRRSFLKLGLAGISGAALLLLSGCLGEEDGDDEDDEDD